MTPADRRAAYGLVVMDRAGHIAWTPEADAKIREMCAAHASAATIGAEIGVRAQVAVWRARILGTELASRRVMTPERCARADAMRAAGAYSKEISRALGVSADALHRWVVDTRRPFARGDDGRGRGRTNDAERFAHYLATADEMRAGGATVEEVAYVLGVSARVLARVLHCHGHTVPARLLPPRKPRKVRKPRRKPPGADLRRVTFTDAMVDAIYALREAGMAKTTIADRVGVSMHTLRRWLRRTGRVLPRIAHSRREHGLRGNDAVAGGRTDTGDSAVAQGA